MWLGFIGCLNLNYCNDCSGIIFFSMSKSDMNFKGEVNTCNKEAIFLFLFLNDLFYPQKHQQMFKVLDI